MSILGKDGKMSNIASEQDLLGSENSLSRSNTNVSVNPMLSVAPSASSLQIQREQARLIYSGHYQGLQTYGLSGMTIQDELIDQALQACENRRAANQKNHSRGAAILARGGKLYTGCDVSFSAHKDGMGDISAERGAVLAAVADGQSEFDCVVIASDTMKSFPAPDGQSREFLRSFGVFSVVLVNCDMQVEETNTHELYPYTSTNNGSVLEEPQGDDADAPVLDEDVNEWAMDRVKRWLKDCGFGTVAS